MDMDSEYQELLNAAIEGDLSESQATRLREFLASDQGGDDYLKWMSLHLALSEREASVRPFSAEELRAVQEVEERFRTTATPEDAPQPTRIQHSGNRGR